MDWNIPDGHLPRFVGWHGDNPYSRLTLPDQLGLEWDIRLDITQDTAGFANIIALERRDGLCYAELTREMLPVAGQYRCQLRAFCGEKVCHSNPFVIVVGQGVNATEQWEQKLPSEFTGLEGRISAMHSSTLAASAVAEEAAVRAGVAVIAAETAQRADDGARKSAAGAAQDRERAETAASTVAELSKQVTERHMAVMAAANGVEETSTVTGAACEVAEIAAGKAMAAEQEVAQHAAVVVESATLIRTLVGAASTAKTEAEAAKRAAESFAGTADADAVRAEAAADRAEEIVGGDFATKEQATGYVREHGEAADAHAALFEAALARTDPAGSAAAVQRAVDSHATDGVRHVTVAERTAWNVAADTSSGLAARSGRQLLKTYDLVMKGGFW